MRRTESVFLIPPPVYGIAGALAMDLLNRLLPGLVLWPEDLRSWPWLIVAAGFAIDLLAVVQFLRARTTVNPLRPEAVTHLVRDGLYRFSRNPMYLGMAISLTGWALVLGSLTPFGIVPVFMWLVTARQIKPEERVLRARYGVQFDRYEAQVNRWFGWRN